MNCTQCGEPYQPGQAFCVKCGNRLEAQAEIPPAAAPAAGVVYAGFWERFAAQFLDGLILWLVTIPLSFLMVLFARNNAPALIGLFYFAWILSYWLYFALLESGEKSATLGKRWLGLKVLGAKDLQRIGFGRATGRFFGRFLSAMLLYIGYLMQPFTEKRQTLHDMMSGTVVIREGAARKRGLVIAIVVLFFLVFVVGILAAISIPAYQDYVNRAHIAQAMTLAGQAEQAVADHYKQTGEVPATLADAGFTQTLPPYVTAIEVNPDSGVIVLTLAGEQFEHGGIIMVPSEGDGGAVTWECQYTGMPERYMTHWPQCRPYSPPQGN